MLIKKFLGMFFLFCLLNMMNTTVGYASATNIDLTIECKDYLQKGEVFYVVNNGKTLQIIQEEINKHKEGNKIPYYRLKTALELNNSKEIEIQYIKNDKLISNFKIEKNKNGELIGKYYFDGTKFSL